MVTGAFSDDVRQLVEFLRGSERLVVLTGAGCSTESGIPDYRSPGGAWSRHKPTTWAEFMRSDAVRRRYWARSFLGWERFSSAAPNPAHLALRKLERTGAIHLLITQNVDRLHHEAGSENVLELHGRNDQIICTACSGVLARVDLHRRLAQQNDAWRERLVTVRHAPDGDAEIDPEFAAQFSTVDCDSCGGVLKPDVVFFGESVPRERVDRAYEAVAAADALLVVGSSLAIWSGYRFVLAAAERKLPIAIVNIGETRADALASLKIERRCGEFLPAAVCDLCDGSDTTVRSDALFDRLN